MLSPLFADICSDIATLVADINADQNYLFQAYLDAQSVNDYGEMGRITEEMSQNNYALDTLEMQAMENDCSCTYLP